MNSKKSVRLVMAAMAAVTLVGTPALAQYENGYGGVDIFPPEPEVFYPEPEVPEVPEVPRWPEPEGPLPPECNPLICDPPAPHLIPTNEWKELELQEPVVNCALVCIPPSAFRPPCSCTV